MTAKTLRPIALCVIRRDDKLLVYSGYDRVKRDHYYRPLGGGIEFGERGATAAAREMEEELQTRVRDVRWLGMLENLFVLDGEQGHEIVLLYEADLEDEALYDRCPIWGQEDDGSPIRAVWKPMSDFTSGQSRLVPEGILAMLDEGHSLPVYPNQSEDS